MTCDHRTNGQIFPNLCKWCRRSLGRTADEEWQAYLRRGVFGAPWCKYQNFDDVLAFDDFED